MNTPEEISFIEYQRLAMRTAKAMPTYQDDLHHAALGIAGEAGEFADAVKKFTIYSKPLDVANAIEELGDLMWYIALAANSLETSMEDIARANITKLKVRYPEKYTDELAVARLDKAVVLGTEPKIAVLDTVPSNIIYIPPAVTTTITTPPVPINWQNLPKDAEGNKVAAVTLARTARTTPIYDVMVDIETLGLEDSAVILQIAAVGKFKKPVVHADDPQYYNSYVDQQAQRDTRTVNSDTLLWWSSQDQDVYDTVSSGTTPLDMALYNFAVFIYALPVPTNMIRFVSKGDFDFRVLEHAYKQADIQIPWKYWQICNLRSLTATFPQVEQVVPTNAHNALSDCVAQMATLEKINALVDSINKQVAE